MLEGNIQIVSNSAVASSFEFIFVGKKPFNSDFSESANKWLWRCRFSSVAFHLNSSSKSQCLPKIRIITVWRNCWHEQNSYLSRSWRVIEETSPTYRMIKSNFASRLEANRIDSADKKSTDDMSIDCHRPHWWPVMSNDLRCLGYGEKKIKRPFSGCDSGFYFEHFASSLRMSR